MKSHRRWKKGPLARIHFALGWLASMAGSCAVAEAAESGLPVLTNLQQVVASGTTDGPLAPYPIRVRGTITQLQGWLGRWITIHDGTTGCAVELPADVSGLRVGQRVEVTGELAAETHFSYIAHARFTVEGDGTWPEPIAADAAKLAAGHHHAGWVKLRASVLDVCRTEGKLVYLLGSGMTSFNLWMEEPVDQMPLEELNATVEVRGVAWSVARGDPPRPVRFTLHTGGRSNLVMVSAGSTNLWGRPALTLRQFADAPVSDDRLVVRGTVTYVNPAGMFILEDGTEEGYVNFMEPIPVDNRAAEFVPREPRPTLRPGDTVEVVGTKRRKRSHSPWLEWAEVRVTGRTTLPEPPRVSPEELLTGQLDCRRVRVEGRVLDHDQLMQGSVFVSRLVAQIGNRTTYVVWPGDRHHDFGPLVGRNVELNGMLVVSSGNSAAVRSFTFYLDNPAGVRLLPPVPIWRQPTVLKVAAGVTVALLLTGTWIVMLRRQVAHRTAALASSNERLRRNEQELQRALAQEQELHQLKANFVSMVSHEFRTPLGVIVSSTDILRRYLDRLNPRMRSEQLDIIQRSTGTLSGLVEDLLLLGKAEAGKLVCQPSPIDLETLCRHLADEASSATKQACPIQLTLEGDFSAAVGDESLLRPALTNLLTNAIKYSPPGAPVEFRVIRRDGVAEFVIGDRGIGIPQADQSRLFSAFARGTNVGARPGTGLGLVIAKRCVDLHGGTILFRSEAGEGTTFTLTLPLFNSRSEADLSTSSRRAKHSHTTA